MTPICECAMLHEDPSTLRGCGECGTVCCSSCAVEIESHTYCRWCALVLAPAVPA